MTRSTLAALAIVALLAGACTTLPKDSQPRIVKQVEPAGSPFTSPTPVPTGSDPRTVVSYFLDGNANVNDSQHVAAQSVLTGEGSWNSSGTTVVDRVQIANPVGTGDQRRVTVSGQPAGTLDADGRYTPNLGGSGSTTYSKDFVLTRVSVTKGQPKQWRIAAAPKGVLLSEDQFENYRQRILYFFDSSYPAATTQFVPEPRYTPLSDPASLADWLVKQLAVDPGNAAVQTGLQVTDPSTVQVTFPTAQSPPDTPVRVEVPASRRLDLVNGRNALAAELGATLSQIPSITALQITDNGTPVRIPAVSGTTFAPDTVNLLDRYQVAAVAPKLFYVDSGGVFAQDGSREQIAGLPRSATDGYSLASVALRPAADGGAVEVAATYGTGDHGRLAIGTQGRLKLVAGVTGRLSRPSWQPDGAYAWVGAGKDLWRVSASGTAKLVNTDLPGGQRLSAVRVSPDGGRIALVVTSTGSTVGSTSQVYIGTIQAGVPSSIVDPQAITPSGVLITDVGWYDELKLFAVGTVAGLANDFVFYEVQCDGSGLTPRSTSGLPGAPDSLAVADGSLAVVSVGGTLWQQSEGGDRWDPLRADARLPSNPVYVE